MNLVGRTRWRRAPRVRNGKEGTPTSEGQFGGPVPLQQTQTYKAPGTNESPEPMSSNGTGSSQRSLQPSPTNSAHGAAPVRKLDEDYDGDDDGHGLVIDEAFDADSLYSSMCLRRAASASVLVEVETEAEAKGRLVLFVGEEVHF